MTEFDIVLYIVGIILVGGIIFAPIGYHIGKMDASESHYPRFRRCRHESHRREK